MRRIALIAGAGAALLAPAAAADGAPHLSTARAEVEARRVVAPQAVESVFCLRAPQTRRRAKITRQYCLVRHPAARGHHCVTTVVVSSRMRPRRVKARVTVPARCFEARPPLGSPDSL